MDHVRCNALDLVPSQGPISPLVLGDCLLRLAVEADEAGLATSARRLLGAALAVYGDGRPRRDKHAARGRTVRDLSTDADP